MSYLNNTGGNSVGMDLGGSSSLMGNMAGGVDRTSMMGEAGGLDLASMSMLGSDMTSSMQHGVGGALSSSALSGGGMSRSREDLLHGPSSQHLHHQSSDATDLSSIYPSYMSSAANHVTNAQKHGYATGDHTTVTNTALHNGLSNYDVVSHHQELQSLRPFHQQDSYYNNHDQLKGQSQADSFLPSASTLTNRSDYLDSYNSQELQRPTSHRLHHPSALIHSSSLLPPHERDLIAQAVNKGSTVDGGGASGWLHAAGAGGVGLGTGSAGAATGRSAFSSSVPHQNPYLLDDTEFLIRQRQQEDFGVLSSEFHSQDLHLSGLTQEPQHPTHSQSHRPVSAPLLTQNSQNQYNRLPQVHPASGYGASAPTAAAAASNYEYNLRFASNNFSNATNLNAHYPSGGAGGPASQSVTGPGDLGLGPSMPGSGGFFGNSGGRTFGTNNAPVPGGGAFTGGGMVGGPGTGMEEVRQQSLSSESQAYYGNETMVKELRPEFVRWFYRYEQDRKWTPFTGYDSIRVESKYREVFRDHMSSYSHCAYYPVASSNDESTDFSKFCYQTQMNQQEMQNFIHMQGGGGTEMGGRFGGENTMQQKWWPGKSPGTTVDTEFNNGGPGFPSQIRNNSAGTNLFGRNPNTTGLSKEKMLHKANSASALLGGPGTMNGMTSGGADMNKVIIVREGLYEVDLSSWTCFSTYWPGDTCIITRGTWFFDGTWDPLPVEQAEKLEEAHMSKFCGAALINTHQNAGGQGGPHYPIDDMQNRGTTAAGANNAPALHRISFNDFHVDWTSPTDVFWYSAATSHKLMRSVGQKLGFSDWGHRICRGYYKPALIVDRPSEISHIVFVIHGIGQKMDTGRIVRNCSAFRDCVSSMKDKFFPQLNNAKQRAEFFPVEWRSAAKLDQDVVDAITPQKLLSLRQLLNSTAMDIMYYTSPLYRAEIQNALIDELNRIYANFVKRNPNFVLNGGRVSVMAHSLGAVITYDILTGYLCGSVADDMSLMQQQYHQMPRRVLPQQQGLLFTLEHFFCLGSPLSVFLALRWREPHDPGLRPQILPQHLCKRIYNVFYSSDPVAYRLEPLLIRQYAKIAPVTIHAYNAPVKPRYSEMPRERITIVSKTGTDNIATNNNTSATSTLPGTLLGDNASMSTAPSSSLKPPMPSLPSLPKPSLPSVMNMKLPPSPNRGGGGPDQQGNNWGGWFGGNIMKLWKGSTSPAAGLLDHAGLGQFGGAQQPTADSSVLGGMHPTVASGGMVPPTNPMDEAAFLAQQSKENYSTVVDEELSHIPNDLEYRLDYVLRESQFSGSSYIAALTSHTSYWNSPDAAYFVMTHLYDDLIEQTTYSGER